MKPIVLNDTNFEEEVIKSEVPVLVDFFATWCGPCSMLAPVIEEIAENADGYKVGKLDVDESMEIAMKYGVQSIPTLIVFKNGEVSATNVGVITEDEIYDMIEK